jgi:hypothetical protein
MLLLVVNIKQWQIVKFLRKENLLRLNSEKIVSSKLNSAGNKLCFIE